MVEFLRSLGIEPAVALAQAIAFVILLVLLARFLYRPLDNILRQREEQVANDLAGAEAQHAKAGALRREYEAHLAQIADEARARVEQAVRDADAVRRQQLEAAQAEMQALYARHEAQLALEREQLRRELRQEMSDIAVQAAQKALRARMTPELQAAVIDQVIAELDQTTLQ
ncbi:MAG TPA: F0F1 ATP synthase subunit B [Armatimonadota bacterium]|nr:F0F1 ATP synthase subunit B [Armatimonadota bacterium]HOS43891.1 F0F1 ATP synthase subunit B [Armatimonadota bacterium]